MGPTASSSTGFAPGSLPSGPSLLQAGGAAPLDAITISVVASILSLPASLLGNEAALRFGRHRAITVVMLGSAVVASAIAVTAGVSAWLSLFLLLLYALTVPADSGALTSGVTAAADAQYRARRSPFIRWWASAYPRWAVGRSASRSTRRVAPTAPTDGPLHSS